MARWSKIVIEAGVVRGKSVVLCATLRDNNNVERCRKVCDCWIWYLLEGISEETKSPVNLTIPDTRLAGGSKNRLRSCCAVGVACIVCELSKRGIEESSAVSVPNIDCVSPYLSLLILSP